MKQSVIARGLVGGAAVLLLAGILGQVRGFSAIGVGVGLGVGVREAKADEVKPATGGASGPLCVLTGSSALPKGSQIFDAASGGRAIANFTGTFVPLRLSEIPADPVNGRARLSTTSGSSSFRIDGYVSPGVIPVFTTRDLSITREHLWISVAQRVKLVQAANNALTVERTVLGTSGQTVRATGPCDAFALQPGTPTAMEVPGNGRGYLTKSANTDFFDAPNGNAIFTLKMIEGGSQLFWSTEAKAGFVHIKARSDLTIDAWARLGDLDPLKKGEMMDHFIPPTTQVQGAQLALDKPPRLVQATKEIPLRFKRDEKDKPIGAVEVGAEIYVMETMAGWSNVLPKNLSVLPPDDGGFWIPSGEVPK
jgi:hypothetical protein